MQTVRPLDLKPVLDAVLAEYVLEWHGIHGVSHWARVLENGRRLAEQTGANVAVVSLFAVLHDSRRENERTDRDHGLRAAAFAEELRGREVFTLDENEFVLLYRACAGHTHERTDRDVTVQTCFDADRLDLGRVGATPDPRYLCTAAAQKREMIAWADGRGTFRVVPPFVKDEWGVVLKETL